MSFNRFVGIKVGLVLIVLMLGVGRLHGQEIEIEKVQEQYRTGQYTLSLENSRQSLEERRYNQGWRILYLKSLMAVGDYVGARSAIKETLQRYPVNLQYLSLAYGIYLSNGDVEKADDALKQIVRYGRTWGLEYWNSQEIVALGEALLKQGAEPRLVLESHFGATITKDPDCLEAYLAAGHLALDKNDYELASDYFQQGLKRFNDEPDLHFGLAQAFYHSDRETMIKSLDAALFVNPNHVPSLLLMAEHLIDAEDREGAERYLERALAVNKRRAEAWAFKSLLAYLDNDPEAAKEYRARALENWRTNPKVDYLIGKKLSQNYRFAEGAAYQQLALSYDVNFSPAKMQLATDLLRLGYEEQGWELVQGIYEQDAYNVEAYNLVSLSDHMAKFKTLETDEFVVRMAPLEADIFGDMVLELLAEAKDEVCDKYGIELTEPVTVEMFDNQQDFAVRTFGMPGGDGFLGVCFGPVITMNSPKAERPANWEATLWHEFCHVVTLHLTKNKMPRWLSEGISVYEESQKNRSWGQRMTPEYRQMILSGELTPLSKLSGAFINPATPIHLYFAYYEASLAVEYIIETYGVDALKAVLVDLADGEPINEILVKHVDEMDKLEAGLEKFVKERAANLAPGLDWSVPELDQMALGDSEQIGQWLEAHPDSLWGLLYRAVELIREEKFAEAKAPLERLIELYPDNVEADSPYIWLAEVHRQLGETDEEYAVLSELAARSADAVGAYERLVELAVAREDWAGVVANSRRYLAVNPMLAKIHRQLGQANESLGDKVEAVKAYLRLLKMDPADPVEAHYRIAVLLQESDPAAAKRHVLLALADAPRFQAGHKLLLELVKKEKK